MGIILFVILIISCQWIAVIYQWPAMDMIVRAFVILGIVDIVACIYGFFKIKFEIISSKETAIKGKKIPMTIMIDNKGLLPAASVKVKLKVTNTFCDATVKKSIQLPVRKWGTHKYTFAMRANTCGDVTVSIDKVIIRDFFGLLKLRKRPKSSCACVVLPPYIEDTIERPAENNAVFVDSDIFSKTKPGSDPSEVFDIRPMKESDPIKSINWKMTLRQDTYMVNEYSLPQGNGTVIMLDTCINNDDKEKMDITDRLFEVVMMIMLRLCEYEVVHKVVWYDSNMKMCRYVDIMPDDNVTGVFFEIYKSHAYTGDNVFFDVFNSQFNVGMFSHVYYVGNECGQSTIYKLVEGKEHAIKTVFDVKSNSADNNKEDTVESTCMSLGVELIRL